MFDAGLKPPLQELWYEFLLSATTSKFDLYGLEDDQEDWEEDDWTEGLVPLEDDQEVLWTFPPTPSPMSV